MQDAPELKTDIEVKSQTQVFEVTFQAYPT
jgi:hypothetical protein